MNRIYFAVDLSRDSSNADCFTIKVIISKRAGIHVTLVVGVGRKSSTSSVLSVLFTHLFSDFRYAW
jgi:hypothetical protein